jgi:hypothetical protein
LFDGLMLTDIQRDPVATLAEVFDVVFEPVSVAAREALIEVWRNVEDSYLNNCREGQKPQAIGLTRVQYSGVVPPVQLAERPEYLLRMKPEGLAKYADALHSALNTVRRICGELGNREKAARLERTIGLAVADVQRVQAWKTPF